MFRKFLTATTKPVIIFSATVIKADNHDKNSPATIVRSVEIRDPEEKSFIRKPSELPLYTPINSPLNVSNDKKLEKKPTFRDGVESVVRVVRSEVQSRYYSVAEQVKILDGYIDTAKAHSQQIIEYLNEPQNTYPRAGAIGVGGLAGFILASRGGFIRKVFYSAIGAGAIASLCYPEEAEIYAREALHEARRNYTIAANFIRGVKPGDEEAEQPINFPTSIDELKTFILDLYDEAVAVITDKKK